MWDGGNNGTVFPGTGYLNGQINFPSPDISRNSEIVSREGFSKMRQEEMSERLLKLKEEDDEEEIVAGKFSPCGGECEQGSGIIFF